MPEISSKNKIRLFVAAGILLIAANLFCYAKEFQRELKLRNYSFSEQLLYHPEFAKEGYAPDALVREIIRGKTVKVPRDVRPYKEYWSYGRMHDEGNPFAQEYFSENNYNKYMSEYAGKLVVDTSLPDLYELEEEPVIERISDDFINIGRGHELLRYAFIGDHTDEETTNQFFYSYYYTTDAYYQDEEMINIRICPEGLAKADTVIALWDKSENLYLMSEDYYRETIDV
ncbi:MAG: hypothetical protein K6G03_08855 [Lachnospiraceae bacterium]|nr:hypothetical protein [Lachnospiraceae bacterium]